ncbi:peroxisomal membrane 4 [Brachionus plicatilis]|uniref:Peroxisomal membrane 4 n=1 Tax=Brachionus plicatilis TaxID=10195 RepID=A0A3M7PS84_BRAPC|nr:peroxisomal membrane 4 [Brachionus plicatilis]
MSASLFILANRLVNDPSYRPFLALIKGIRNGIVYGCKIRFPHALVMTFLFRNGTLAQKVKAIFKATKTHAANLAKFVFVYKSIRLLAKITFNEIKQYHTLVAAFIGGYLVFGEKNNVNEQINMYLLSRILVGLAKLAQEKNIIPNTKQPIFPWFGALVWAIVLWIFEYHQHVLQPSLQSSMTYLYHDSNRWNSIKNLLVYNK